MLSGSRESRRPGTNFLRAETPGVAPRSVRTGLRGRIPALVAGTPARCPGVLTWPRRRRPRGSLLLVPRTPSTAPSARAGRGPPATSRRPPRVRGNADCPAGGLDPRAGPLAHPLPRPLRTGGGCPEVLGYIFLRPERTFLAASNRPFLHAAVLQHFRHRGGKAAAISNKTQELVCDSSAWIPPVPKLCSRSFLG